MVLASQLPMTVATPVPEQGVSVTMTKKLNTEQPTTFGVIVAGAAGDSDAAIACSMPIALMLADEC